MIAGCSNTIIPNNIKTIESEAFYGCCGLKDVTIPSSVKNIGNDAFANCSGLESIIVESGNTIYDSRNNCNAINETSSNTLIVGCKNTIISNNIQTIGMDAFKGCGLTYITIPKSVSKIQDCAFSLLNIQTVVSQIEYPFESEEKIIGMEKMSQHFHIILLIMPRCMFQQALSKNTKLLLAGKTFRILKKEQRIS